MAGGLDRLVLIISICGTQGGIAVVERALQLIIFVIRLSRQRKMLRKVGPVCRHSRNEVPLHRELIFLYVAAIPLHLKALPFLFALPHQPVLEVDPNKIKQLLPRLFTLRINGDKQWPLDRRSLIRTDKRAIVALIKSVIYPLLIFKTDFIIKFAVPSTWNGDHGDVESRRSSLHDGENWHWSGTFFQLATRCSYFDPQVEEVG